MSFPISEVYRGNWDAEYKIYNKETNEYTSEFYSFSMNQNNGTGPIYVKVYEGDWILFVTPENDTRPVLSELEIALTGDQAGSLLITKPYERSLADFEFVETFPHYLGATGVFNQTLTYSVSIVNLAITHIHLYSINDNVYNELILTRTRRTMLDPWYWRYNKVIIGVGFFIITYIILNYSSWILTKLGIKSEEKPDEKAKGKQEQKPKEKAKKE